MSSSEESSLNDVAQPVQNDQIAHLLNANDDLSSDDNQQEADLQNNNLQQNQQPLITINEFVRDRDTVIQGYKLAACMRALCLKYDLELSNRFQKSTESPDWYQQMCLQAESYNEDELIRGVKMLINQRKTIETFDELYGFDLLPLFLGQRQEETKPDAATPFPDATKARVLFEILNHINPQILRYVYNEFRDSKLVSFVNFVAMFPLQCCPSQQLKSEAKQIIDKWRAPLRQARKAAETLQNEPDDDEDEENQGRNKNRGQNIQFNAYRRDDFELQQTMDRVKQREEQMENKRAKQ